MWLIVLNCVTKIAFYVKKRVFLPSSLLLDLPPNLNISEGIVIPPILFDFGFKKYLFLWNKLELTRIWRRKWQPTLVFLPGESHGQRTWWATVHGVTNSRTRLSDFTHSLTPPHLYLNSYYFFFLHLHINLSE